MAISRIGGRALKSNLERDENLTFNTDTLVVDYANGRIGINKAVPTQTLDIIGNAAISGTLAVTGSLDIDSLTIDGSTIEAAVTNTNINIITHGTGVVSLQSDVNISESLIFSSGVLSNKILDEDDFASNDDEALATQQSIKAYVDAQVAGAGSVSTGMDITLGSPTDGSLTVSGAYQGFTSSNKVTDAIDDLNEIIENIRNNTFIKEVSFVSDITVGGAGFTSTLTISTTGTADSYNINWGDGTVVTGTSDSTPSHQYTNYTDSPYDIIVTALNSSGSGTGSSASATRSDYITVYTPDPVVGFAAYAAASGGSPITYWDDGATVYFENTTTNTVFDGATLQHTWNWGDGSSNNVVSSNTDAGGKTGDRLAHTFSLGSETDAKYTVSLSLDSLSTANPSSIPPTPATQVYTVYDTHTPTVAQDIVTGINEQSTNGLTVTLANTTESTIGSYSSYGTVYNYTFGDGTAQSVQVGSGSAGDTGRTISHTYSLSGSDQANGVAKDFVGNISVSNNHTQSPFISSSFSVHIEPDVRSTMSGTAVTISDKAGDNQYTIYDGIDYLGNNRALVRVTNTTQNADDYVYNWGDSSSNDIISEDGIVAGSTGATIDHDYTGISIGSKTLTLTANGTPDITLQTSTSTMSFQLSAIPSAPDGMNTKSIILANPAVGIQPKLAVGFTDNSSSNPLVAGTSLATSTNKRLLTGTATTSWVSEVYDGMSGTLSASINGVSSGDKSFTAALGETGTFTDLIIANQIDYHDIDNSMPSYFYQVFNATISKDVSEFPVGVSDIRLEHTTTGNTNYVSLVKDSLSVVPTLVSTGNISENVGGTKKYISGIPYYNSGSPSLLISGITVSNLTGQAYTGSGNIVTVAAATNYEGTTGQVIPDIELDYIDIDGASTMLSGGIPTVDIGVVSPYVLGNLIIPIESASMIAIGSLKEQICNVNGPSTYSNLNTKIQVHTLAQTGINETAIPVSDSLGNGLYTDDAVRIFNFSADTTNTPSYTNSTNFYTNSVFSEAADPGVSGTKEATVRLGVLAYNITNYSTGYLPVGPDRSGDTGTQYFTFAFRRRVVANFDIAIESSTGVSGVWYALPGSGIDASSGLNGWVECTSQYAGVGIPGTNTGAGGNGLAGGAYTGADVIPTGTSINGTYTMTLGSENMSNSTGNVVIIRVALVSGQSVSALSIGVAA